MKTENQYINRELSWLKFNARVLQEAADERVPLLERLRFAGIFSNNLDEFFKVRYATVKRVAMNETSDKELGVHAKELLEEITKEVILLQDQSLKIIASITKELEKEQIFIVDEKTLLPEHESFVNTYFYNKVRPALFTIILNDLEMFPQLKDDVAYLAVKMTLKEEDEKASGIEKFFSSRVYKEKIQYALIELPTTLDRFIELPQIGDKHYIIMLDDVIRFCLHKIFNIFNYESLTANMIKITRDAELDIDDDLSKSFIEKISTSVEDRRKGEPVRFVYDKMIDKDTLQFLFEKMGIVKTDSVIPGGRYHNRRDFMSFPSLGRKDLTYPPIQPLPVQGLTSDESLLKKIAEKDYLQYTPYHTFSNIIWFLREAALDPKVKSVKITIYRLAKNSQVVNSLINAVKNGKQVTVQIELQARFDEESNIRYAEQLKAEGVRGLKVHSKICVIERKEGKELKRYGFISTGNFNESTAKIYTDYTLFTANQEILKEVNKVFNFFDTNYNVQKFKHLIVSPHYTKKQLKHLIDEEIKNAKAGKEAYIKLKMNNITSYKMIDKLYEASRAGVKIQMIVRGICCLVPGIEGMSENIEVISIVDKFLEHPRLFIFGNGGTPKVYISSADWMTRNISFRVEVGCPIYDKTIQQELIDTFEISWADNVKARIINKAQDNTYRPHTTPALRSQVALYEYYQHKNKLTE